MADIPFTITVDDDGSVVIQKFEKNVKKSGSTVRRVARGMSRAFRGVTRGLKGVLKSVFSLKGALVGLGAGLVLKSIANVGRQVEIARSRLVGLRGSVEGANEAFDFFQKVAGKVAFGLNEVVEAGVALEAFGAKSEDTLEAVTDLAAFMGIDLPTAASAFGRAFAGGAGAADILRERGVLTLISLKTGIDDLTKLSLPEFRKALLRAMRDPTGPIADSAQRLGQTFEGVLSFLGDALFRLQQQIFELGIGDILKDLSRLVTGLLNSLGKFLKANEAAVMQFFQSIRENLPGAADIIDRFARILFGLGEVISNLGEDIFFIFKKSGQSLFDFGADLSEAALDLGSFSVALGAMIEKQNEAKEAIDKVSAAVEAQRAAFNDIEALIARTDDLLEIFTFRFAAFQSRFDEFPKTLERFTDAFDPLLEQFSRTGDPAMIAKIEALITSFFRLGKTIEDVPKALRPALDAILAETTLAGDALNKLAKEQADNLVAIERSKRIRTLQETAGLFGALGNLLETGGEKNFKIVQKFRIADAIISGIAAVNKVLAEGPPFPANVIAAAAIAVQTLANVRKIRQATPGGGGGSPSIGGGGGGGGGFGAPAPIAEPVAARAPTQVVVNIAGSFIGDEATLGTEIVRIVNQAIDDGATVQAV